MEQTAAFNGTTTKDPPAWKTKKGFGPWIVVATLLLGLAFHAGQMSGSSRTVAGRTRGGGAAADASLMSVDNFEGLMRSGQDCDDNTCCGGQICDPDDDAYKTVCGYGKTGCGNYVCIKVPPPMYPIEYRCQAVYRSS